MKPRSLAIRNIIDVETELFCQGTSGEYILLRTDRLPENIAYLRIKMEIRLASGPVKQVRFTLKPSDVNRDGLILVRLPGGLPFSLAELRLDINHVRGPVYVIKVVPNRKEFLWKRP